MATAYKAAMLQPISKLFYEWFGATDAFAEEARHHFAKLGEVVGDISVRIIERAEINGEVMPWGYELDGEWIQLPDDYVMARYEAYVVPDEEWLS